MMELEYRVSQICSRVRYQIWIILARIYRALVEWSQACEDRPKVVWSGRRHPG